MNKIKFSYAIFDNKYSAVCADLCLLVGSENSFEELKKTCQESLDFYIQCCKEDGEPYPVDYELEFNLKNN